MTKKKPYHKSINWESRILSIDDNLYELSDGMEQYKGYRISEIDPIAGTVMFTNGEMIHRGDVVGDISEQDMRRIQIRETIKSHFEKEEALSLFFIDEVAKYRRYDEDGAEVLGEYGRMFEQEYNDLILKNKERLLSFEEPTRFIFSHSVLREGWDNPNVFQICTLKHSDSTMMKRQEVGRGLRLCVDQGGFRMDEQSVGISLVHKINNLAALPAKATRILSVICRMIAETKGTMESLQLRPIEKAKISCARKLFNEISTENVVYHDVDSYQHLLDIMPTISKAVTG